MTLTLFGWTIQIRIYRVIEVYDFSVTGMADVPGSVTLVVKSPPTFTAEDLGL